MTAKPLPSPGYPTVGSIINGKYQVEDIIGEGGVGIVVSAQNIELGDRVALKFLRKEMLDRSDVVGRFMFEAKAASTIKCDHSATVFDVGRTADGVPFLVMEFLEGRDLASVIEHGPIEVRDLAEFAMHTCEALAAAHAKGIVHRDIKPENLFITQRGGMRSIKVLDFGISKTALTGSAVSSLLPMVQTQNLMGTPLYMSPEQIRAPELVDARTDIYSLGVVMYESLTGTLPILGESITELCAAILEQTPTPISQYRPDLPTGLVDVINKCMAKEQKDRYQNAAEVAIALMPFAPKRARICAERAGESLIEAGLVSPASVRFASEAPSSLVSGAHPAFTIPRSTPLGISLAPSDGAVAMSSMAPTSSQRGAPRKDNRKLVVAAVAMLLGLAGGAYALMNRGASPEQPAKTVASPPAAEPVPTAEPSKAVGEAPKATATQEVAKPVESVQDTTPAKPAAAPAPPAIVARPVAPTPARPVKPSGTPTSSGKKVDALDIGY